jgi:hypothetical protein
MKKFLLLILKITMVTTIAAVVLDLLIQRFYVQSKNRGKLIMFLIQPHVIMM